MSQKVIMQLSVKQITLVLQSLNCLKDEANELAESIAMHSEKFLNAQREAAEQQQVAEKEAVERAAEEKRLADEASQQEQAPTQSIVNSAAEPDSAENKTGKSAVRPAKAKKTDTEMSQDLTENK